MKEDLQSAAATGRRLIPWETLTALKGIAAIQVVLVHSPAYRSVADYLNPFNVAVVLFLFVQAFIVFSKLSSGERSVMSYFRLRQLRRMALRVILPWALVDVLFAVFGFRCGYATDWIWNLGAFGPGSYYLMLYLLSYAALPFLWLGLRACGAGCLAAGVLVAVAMEFAYPSLLDFGGHPNLIYRCTPVRYLGVFVLAFVAVRWLRAGLTPRLRLAIAAWSLVSLALAYVRSLAPAYALPLPADYGWWICHLVYYVFPCGAALLALEKLDAWPQWLLWVGRKSWWIFLAQMFGYAIWARFS